MNSVDVLKGLHWGERAFSVFLELLIVRAVSIDFGFPFKGGVVFNLVILEVHQKGPNKFAVDKIVKAAMSTSSQEFEKVAILLWGLMAKFRITFLKII